MCPLALCLVEFYHRRASRSCCQDVEAEGENIFQLAKSLKALILAFLTYTVAIKRSSCENLQDQHFVFDRVSLGKNLHYNISVNLFV